LSRTEPAWNDEQRELFRVGLDADLFGIAAGNVAQAYIVGLHQLGAQLIGQFVKILIGPGRRRLRLRRQRQRHDGDVVDAAADDQRLRDADGNAADIGADFLVHAQDSVVGPRADQKARGHHDAVVDRLAVDVLDAVDGLDDGFERLGHQFDRVRGLEAVGVHPDVDHRHADLRLFFARDCRQRDQPDCQRRQQEQRRQRRTNGRLRQTAGQSEIHGCTNTSPLLRPERISSASGMSGRGSTRPRCTGTSIVSLPLRTRA
jgi:hypothetical protein